jgi:DNA-binding response OmpR family regulator
MRTVPSTVRAPGSADRVSPSVRLREAARPRILVVEDDAEMRELLRHSLQGSGYAVTTVGHGQAAAPLVLGGAVDAVILDVWLPGTDGLTLCRGWRQSGVSLPILMVTARTDVAARVKGLDAGADDYLGKPFALAELRARLRAVLRRGRQPLPERLFHHERIRVDFARRQAWRNGHEVPITRRELEVLERLVQATGHAVSREDLLQDIWGESNRETAASLEVIIARLRRKLEGTGGPVLIRTIRGFGYAIAPDPELS